MFDYLGVLISIILGLALTHLLLGLSRMIEARHAVRIYWVQLVWTGYVLLHVLAVWWGMFWWKHLTVWTFQMFLFLAFYAGVLFMLAAQLFPHDACEDVDFEDRFFRNRRWFFATLLLAFLLDVPETLAKGVSHLRDVPWQYKGFLPSVALLAAIGLVTANRRAHAAIAVTAFLLLASYLTLSSLDRIDAR